jgi:DNA-directed RNA polymerase subunit F
MIGKGHTDSKPVSITEALEILEERKKSGELGYEQQLAYDHAKKFAKLTPEKAKKLGEELAELGLSRKGVVKIVDVLPINELQLKNVLVIEKKTIEEQTIKKILDILEKYRGK